MRNLVVGALGSGVEDDGVGEVEGPGPGIGSRGGGACRADDLKGRAEEDAMGVSGISGVAADTGGGNSLNCRNTMKVQTAAIMTPEELTSPDIRLRSYRCLSDSLIVVCDISRSSGDRNSSNIPFFTSSGSSSRSLPFPRAGSRKRIMGALFGGEDGGGTGEPSRSRIRLVGLVGSGSSTSTSPSASSSPSSTSSITSGNSFIGVFPFHRARDLDERLGVLGLRTARGSEFSGSESTGVAALAFPLRFFFGLEARGTEREEDATDASRRAGSIGISGDNGGGVCSTSGSVGWCCSSCSSSCSV